MKQIFMCSYCQYKSNRLYNVERHEGRIHTKRKTKICCGELFISKGTYYAHCERCHPQVRANTYISKDKYQITADYWEYNRFHRRAQEQEKKNTVKARHVYNLRVRRQYTRSFRSTKTQRSVKSKLSLEYSLAYSGVDVENIPLICFIQNQNPSDLQKLAVLNDCNKQTEEISNTQSPVEPSTKTECLNVLNHFDLNREFQNGIQSVEQMDSQNEEYSESASEPTSPISPMALPAKKLILHRFKSSFEQEYKVNLCDANNNRQELNVTKKSRESFTRLVQTGENKENVSYEFNVKQNLNINLDQSVTIPLTTQRHRDFLGTIDFERYKIF